MSRLLNQVHALLSLSVLNIPYFKGSRLQGYTYHREMVGPDTNPDPAILIPRLQAPARNHQVWAKLRDPDGRRRLPHGGGSRQAPGAPRGALADPRPEVGNTRRAD